MAKKTRKKEHCWHDEPPIANATYLCLRRCCHCGVFCMLSAYDDKQKHIPKGHGKYYPGGGEHYVDVYFYDRHTEQTLNEPKCIEEE